MPYLLFASFIGFAGSALIADLGTSDSILPAMINQYTGTVLGAILLAALLAAVMGTAASVTILTSVMLSRDVIGRIKPLDGKAMLTTQRICMIVVAASSSATLVPPSCPSWKISVLPAERRSSPSSAVCSSGRKR